MEMQEVEVFIDKDGQVRIDVRGVKGETCLDLTRDLEEALGGQVELRQMKSDSYEVEAEAAEDQLTLGDSNLS